MAGERAIVGKLFVNELNIVDSFDTFRYYPTLAMSIIWFIKKNEVFVV